jgi:putative SOS response-associated peptidase YedK
MCGRFVVASSPELLAERFGAQEVRVEGGEPSYNIAPRSEVMAIRERVRSEDDHVVRVMSELRWGLVPSWAKDLSTGDRQINARAESLATRAAYKRAFAKRRCLIPADGFYEWKPVPSPTGAKRPKKQPFFVRRRDGEPMAFAGLWEVWRESEDQDWTRTCTIVTTRANDLLAPIHDRMPVVLPEIAWDRWLDPRDTDVDALAELLEPAPGDWFEAYPVSTRVNIADNDGPDLVERIDPDRTPS